MQKQYNPHDVEDGWYRHWLEKKMFAADPAPQRSPYSIVIPPPNVTGILHMGHALNSTLQDALIRFRHMQGYATLWMPGTDHAGIATQNVVERKCAREGKTRHDMGRAAFVEEVWKWKHEHRDTITGQLKKLGASCDWDRERFTMDEGLSRAVREVFVRLYNDGLIYRGKYIINWCPRCRTALSDEEAQHQESEGKLYHFRYPSADGSGFVVVATTRPETMLGDTAVAVNPADGRYAHLVGSRLTLPLTNREIPVITDDFVDREFGTGAVKVTPAHDPNDYQMGQRHNLETLVVMDESGHMCGDIPDEYQGLDRFDCRRKVVEDMQALGFLQTVEPHTHAVGHCYRCATVVEPYYSDQWFVKMQPLARPALEAALDNRLSFFPTRWRATYISWLENIRDWCISRQIWWGHQIPAWYVIGVTGGRRTGETPVIVACDEEQAYALARERYGAGVELEQDGDVLDTWFSSWLWPFSTMGWPDATRLLASYYPTATLVTAPEILFFWVARMVMAGVYCTGKLPFTDVVLHGTVRDKTGRKMSKSLGNVIDPLEIIAQSGADALRFSLLMITAQGADVFLARDTFDIGRNFCNKLWNAARFLLGTVQEPLTLPSCVPVERRELPDRWILSRLAGTVEGVTKACEGYRFNEVCHLLYDFAWHDFCDWYIEAIKPRLYDDTNESSRVDALCVCARVLAGICKMLHPVMPFLTQELWSHLRSRFVSDPIFDAEELFESTWPAARPDDIDREVEERFALLRDIVVTFRTIRSENNIPADRRGSALIIPADEVSGSWLCEASNLITLFVRLSQVRIGLNERKPSFAGEGVVRGNQLFLEFEGLIDKRVERERITKDLERVQGLVRATAARLESPGFTAKAPPQVVAREREKCEGLRLDCEKLEKSLARLSGEEG